MTLFWISLALIILILIGLTVFFALKHREEREAVLRGDRDSQIFGEELESTASDSRRKTAFRIARNVFGWILDAVLAVSIIIFLLSAADRVIDSFTLPYHTAIIATGSMSEKNEKNRYLFDDQLDDQLQVNDWIGLRSIDSLDEVDLYDIIAYINQDGLEIVHRVVDKEDGYVITRGDANEASDSMRITAEDIVGVYTGFRVPKVGAVVFFVKSEYGALVFFAILYLLILYECLQGLSRRIRESRLNYLRSVIVGTDFTIVSPSGTLTSKGATFNLDTDHIKEDGSVLVVDGQTIPLPESDYKKWKTN